MAVRLAVEMLQYVQEHTFPGTHLELRIGINSGEVVAGVIGKKKFIYDLWGEKLNVASRMESKGIPGGIQIARGTYELVHDEFVSTPQPAIDVKGKGETGVWPVDASAHGHLPTGSPTPIVREAAATKEHGARGA